MQLTDYLSDLTGLSPNELFGGDKPLVALSVDGEGNHTIDTWSVPNVTKPTADQISKALADTSESKLYLTTYATDKQIVLRDGGMSITVGSNRIDVATDTVGRGLLAGLVQLATLDNAASFQWVNNDGTSVTLAAADVTKVGVAAGQFVQATYSVLGGVLADVKSGKVTTTSQIDSASWPATTK